MKASELIDCRLQEGVSSHPTEAGSRVPEFRRRLNKLADELDKLVTDMESVGLEMRDVADFGDTLRVISRDELGA